MVRDTARRLIPLINRNKGPRSMLPEAVHVSNAERQWKVARIRLIFQTAKFKADSARTKDVVPKDELVVSDAVMCRAFPTTLRKAAHAWFKSLCPRSIHSFAQLTDLFQNHFVSSKTQRTNSASLLNVVQERNESLAYYLGRFNAATLEIDNLDESVKYTAFLRGLRPTFKFAFAINKKPPGNMSALWNKANKYIQAEDYLETHKGN
ncbi:hypothetical protein RJ639_041784 [Escallonia herrerae]|uniref:Retrotransposon gag domain-containing protein n=1 Tax=Escallonia herrerae TaxID=1293975 RepID=A0AA88WF13_9ASTE|nr:hypothetical protein RJ639_041784 [Escallonia herrerae]